MDEAFKYKMTTFDQDINCNEQLHSLAENNMLAMRGTEFGDDCDNSDSIGLTALFLTCIVISVILATVTVIGNCIVIFLGSRTRYGEALKYLNKPVRSLAVTDILIGVIGMPLIVTYYVLG